MGKLLDFIVGNPIDDLKKKIYITGDRFRNEDGSQGSAEITIKAVTQDENQRYIKQAQSKLNKKGEMDFNSSLYQMTLLLNHVVEPDFNDEATLQALGVNTPREAVNKFLLPGEITEIVSKITELSGFNNDPNDEIEEIKNS